MDADTLALLEEKIQRAIETVAQLRKERDAALATAGGLNAAETRIAELTKELDDVRAERDSLKAERESVKDRLQKLLGHIDRLNAGS
ncbi:MAG: cell division protein ZapB [Bryobacteraceae bacterium]